MAVGFLHNLPIAQTLPGRRENMNQEEYNPDAVQEDYEMQQDEEGRY